MKQQWRELRQVIPPIDPGMPAAHGQPGDGSVFTARADAVAGLNERHDVLGEVVGKMARTGIFIRPLYFGSVRDYAGFQSIISI